ncbi:hypothetical protein [Halorussus marinus]|uniref:hypothetical protein n=1 Tax=Halorussus marinus TaxID=2505976 RepID=UPI00106DF000|nr:hypothetical protein [Halorussus marinus]
MNRRQYIHSVGGIALTPTLSVTDTRTSGHITGEEYKQRVPTRLGEYEVSHGQYEHEIDGTYIYSYYTNRHPFLKISYTEKSDSQIRATAGTDICFKPNTVYEGYRFLRAFKEQVSYWSRGKTGNKYSYRVYTIGDWTVTLQGYGGGHESSTLAVIDGELIDFQDKQERQRAVSEKVINRIL